MPGPYPFKQIFAADPSNTENVARGGEVLIFAPGDPSRVPLMITDLSGGIILPNPVKVNENGFGPAFMHDTLDQVAWEGGGFSDTFESYRGMKDESESSRQAAEAARADAQAAAEMAVAPTSEVVEALLGDPESAASLTVAASLAEAVAMAVGPLALKPDNGARAIGKGELVVNVKDFGALGDGIANDFPAIQAALTAAAGKTLLIPPGTYRIIDQLRMQNGTTIDATGATIFADWGGGGDYSMVVNGTPNDLFYGYAGQGNLTFIGGIYDARGHATRAGFSSTFSLGHADKITMRGVTMRNVRRGHAIDCTANRNVTLLQCHFEGYSDTGAPRVSEAVQIDLAIPTGFPPFGSYDSTPTSAVVIDGCTFGPSADCGLWPRAIGSHSARTDKQHTQINIVNNRITASESAVRAYNWSEVVVAQNTIVGCAVNVFAINGATPSAETMDGAGNQTNASASLKSFIISGNNISGVARHSIYLAGYPGSGLISAGKIDNNVIVGTGAGAGVGIFLTNVTSCTVSSNDIRSTGASGIRISNASATVAAGNVIDLAGEHGIMLDVSTDCSLAANVVTNSSAHGISLSGSGSDNTVTGNNIKASSRGTNLSGCGIRLNSVQNCAVTSNRVRSGANTSKPSYGLEIAGGATGTFYTANDLRASGATGSLLNSGIGSISTPAAA